MKFSDDGWVFFSMRSAKLFRSRVFGSEVNLSGCGSWERSRGHLERTEVLPLGMARATGHAADCQRGTRSGVPAGALRVRRHGRVCGARLAMWNGQALSSTPLRRTWPGVHLNVAISSLLRLRAEDPQTRASQPLITGSPNRCSQAMPYAFGSG